MKGYRKKYISQTMMLLMIGVLSEAIEYSEVCSKKNDIKLIKLLIIFLTESLLIFFRMYLLYLITFYFFS